MAPALGRSSTRESRFARSVRSSDVSGSGGSVWIEMSAGDGSSDVSGHRDFSRRQSTRSTLRSLRSILMADAEQLIGEVGPREYDNAPKVPRLRFFAFLVLFAVTCVVRWAVLAVFCVQQQVCYAVLQLVMEVVLWFASAVVAFHDADVQQCLRNGPCFRRFLWWLFTIFVLGGLGIIHIKRAWARQMNVAEVLRNSDGRNFLWSGPAVGAERALPVALFCSVFFALINTIAYLDVTEWFREDAPDCDVQAGGFASAVWPHLLNVACKREPGLWLLYVGALLQILQVSFAVAEMDNCVSTYVASRYHFDPRRVGEHMGRLQWLYPVSHMGYRVSEITTRVFVLAEYVVILKLLAGVSGVLISLAMILMSFSVCTRILKNFSPPEERLILHVLIAVPMLFTNLARFVDRPGFRRPAKMISNVMECIHAVEVIPILVIVGCNITGPFMSHHAGFKWRDVFGSHWKNMEEGEGAWEAKSGFATLAFAAVWRAVLGVTVGRMRGHDLHSAIEKGNISEVKKLLDMGRSGEALDPNAQTKDAVKNTPAMVAAASNDVECLKLLMGVGAKVTVRDANDETCIHYAVRHANFEALDFVTRCRGAKEVLRSQHEQLRSLALSHQQTLPEERVAQLLQLLEPRQRSGHDYDSSGALRSIRAHMSTGRHLRELFPDAMEEDVPPLHELRSVSAIVFANAYGPLARIFLPPAAGAGLLPSLRRVRALGQGASGEVIEVEETSPNAVGMDRELSVGCSSWHSWNNMSMMSEAIQRVGSMSPFVRAFSNNTIPMEQGSSPSSSRRFAMKLQAKSQTRSNTIAFSEVAVLRRAAHPFIVKIEEAFQTPHSFALLLELCPGGDLNKQLCALEEDDSPGFPPARAAKYGGQVLLALVFLHEAVGIVYRDVKPENILLSSNDEAKLADFGLAAYVGRKATEVRLPPAGTAGFMAPELILGTDSFHEAEESSRRPSLHSDEKHSDPCLHFETMASMRRGSGSDISLVDPFKTDAYSYGVTFALMMLGSYVAERLGQADSSLSLDDMVLIPMSMSDGERSGLLARAHAEGRISAAACDLLHSLVAHRPSQRLRLGDKRVFNHSYFFESLGCDNLAEYLLPPGAPAPGGGTVDGRARSRSGQEGAEAGGSRTNLRPPTIEEDDGQTPEE